MSRKGAENVVAIDGPAASGKSTVALQVAGRLGMRLVDSGSMYRAVTLLAVERGVPLEDEGLLMDLAREVRRELSIDLISPGDLRVSLGERDVTGDIRSALVGEAVSPVSRHSGVREEMVAFQREIVADQWSVVEGRDIGTTVFPHASLKVFLDATARERAERRYLELKDKGIEVTHTRVDGEIRMRDAIDSSRECSPLVAAEDAMLIDTNDLTIEQVVDEIIKECQARGIVT